MSLFRISVINAVYSDSVMPVKKKKEVKSNAECSAHLTLLYDRAGEAA